jgi:hypothetical protein
MKVSKEFQECLDSGEDLRSIEYLRWLARTDDEQIVEQQKEIDDLKEELSNLHNYYIPTTEALRKEISHLRELLQQSWARE